MREGEDLSKDIPELGDRKQSVATGATATLAAQGTTLALGFFTSIMTARALGVAGKGEAAILLGAPAMVAVILGFGLNIANSYHVGTGRFTVSESVSDSLVAVALASFLGVPGIYLFLQFFVPAVDGASSAAILMAALMFVPLLVNQNLRGVLVGVSEVEALAVRQLIIALLGFVALLTLFFTSLLTVTTAVLLNLAVGILGSLIQLYLLAPYVRATGVVRPSFGRLMEQSAYAREAYVADLAGYLDKRQDIVLLGMLSSAAATGIYSVSVVFAELLWQVPRALAPALRARSLSVSHQDGEAATAAAARVTVAFTLIVFAVLAIVLQPLITSVYGPEFADAYYVFLLLSPGVMVYGVAMVVWNHLLTRRILLPMVAVLITGLNLAINVVLIPMFGSMGAAFASAVSYSLGGALILWRFSSVSGMSMWKILVPRKGDYDLVRESVARMLRLRGRADDEPPTDTDVDAR